MLGVLFGKGFGVHNGAVSLLPDTLCKSGYLLAPVVAQVSKLVPHAVLIRTSLKVEKGRLEGGKQERLTILRAMLEAKLDKEIILRAGFTEEEIEKLSPEGEH